MSRVRATDDIVRTWLESVHENGRPHFESGRRLSADGWLLSSGFGRGSDLAEYLPSGRHGRTRALFLVTGDVFGSVPFHSSVQTIVRMAVASYAGRFPDVDVLLVPFSALLGAGIDRTTIRPLEIRPDRTTETEHGLPETLDLDDLATASRTEEIGYSSRSEVFTWRLGTGARIVRSRLLETWRHVWLDESGAEDPYGYRTAGAERVKLVSTVRPDGQPFELESPRYYRDRRTRWTDDVRKRDGRWYRIERRHWLGDSVFTATVDGRRARRRPVSVRDVIAAASAQVANETALVHTGYGQQYGADISRAPLSARRLFERPLDELDPTAPIVESVPYRVRRRFISSFDSEESRPLYYLATLPYSSRARTVAGAELDLAPAAVHAAIARGRDVRRQGDMFYIGTNLRDEDLQPITVSRARLGQWTNHTAPKRGHVGYVAPITASERTRRRRYRRRWFRDHYGYGTAGPRTAPGTRRDVRRRRAELERDLAGYRRRLRALALGATSGRYVSDSRPAGARRLLAAAIADTRRRLETAETALAELERRRTASRDEYRTSGHTGYVRPVGATDLAFTRGYAVSLWSDAATAVSDVFDKRRRTSRLGFEDYRRRLRSALSVHGTGHTATEVVHATAGRVYVRGTVRHVPSLVGENRAPDHRTIRLGDGRRWYLAVRNTVPRNRDVDTDGRRRV